MTYKARKRLALFILVVGLPIYIIFAATLMSATLNQQIRLPIGIEFLVYGSLGICWVFPLKWVFRGIGQPDPDAANRTE